MKIGSSFVVSAPHERVWQFIKDPTRMLPCIPGCEAIEQTGPMTYRTTVRIEIGPIKTRFNLDVTIEREDPPVVIEATTRGEEGTRASTLTARSRVDVRTIDPQSTEVSYSSEISVVGRLGRFGLGVMKKKAESLGEVFAAAFRDSIEAGGMAESA